MTWTLDHSRGFRPANDLELSPTEVLYEYGSPLLFTADFGLSRSIVYKLDELPSYELYLVCESSVEVVDALKAGKISVRGALENDRYQIIETDLSGRITHYWHIDHSELPEDFLPESGNAVHAHYGTVPDSLEQANSFFSIKFEGAKLHRETISIRYFKEMMDTFYRIVDDVFTPAMLEDRRRKGLLDFEMYQPKVASLLLSIREPQINVERIRQRKISDDAGVAENMAGEIEKNRDVFFDKIEKIVGEASLGSLTPESRKQQFEWLDLIATLVPETDGTYESIQLNAATKAGLESITINQATGDRIKDAHRIASREPLVLTGKIVEINSPSSTFILSSVGHRQTTCVLLEESFRRLERSGELVNGARVSVYGDFERRKRRDKMILKGEPTFHTN